VHQHVIKGITRAREEPTARDTHRYRAYVSTRLLFVQIQLMCGAARSNLLSVNASSDDPNQLNVF
jgi:hypothetical protein